VVSYRTNHCTEAAYSDSLINLARLGGRVNSAVGHLSVLRKVRKVNMSNNFQDKLKCLSVVLFIVCFLSASAVGQPPQSLKSLPEVYLNHLYIVLDKQTYDDIGASEFMRNEFAAFKQETTVSDGSASWTGTYIYGEQTYLEFFNSEYETDLKQGMSGIAFGVEETDAIKLIQNQLNQVGGKVESVLRTVEINERQVPWFYKLHIEYPNEILKLDRWMMEYHQDYLRERRSNFKAEENGITRKQYLMRTYKPERYLKNIFEITVALSQKEANRFVKELEAFKFKIETRGAKKVCVGSDIKLIITQQTETEGIKEVKLTLSRKKKGQKIYKFGGRSALRFNGKMATWTF
jgi:hypothetical protein